MSIKIQILSKRIHKETDKSITFLTSGYNGKFITIPKSQIGFRSEFKKQVSKENGHLLDWNEFDLSDWMFNKKESEFKMFSDSDIVIIK